MEKPTLFDANCFLSRWPVPQPGSYHDANGLLRAMDDCGIAEALVTHPLAVSYDPTTGNDVVKHPRLHTCWVVTPDHVHHEDESLVNRMIEAGVRAVRILPKRIGPIRAWTCGRLLEALARHSVPTLLDFELEHYREHMQNIDWDGLDWALGEFLQLPIILVRIGQALDRVLIPLLERHTNLHIETSYYIGTGGLERLSAQVGAERLLFGTGMPQYAPGPAITLLTYSALAPQDKLNIGGDNLRRLLGVVGPSTPYTGAC